MSESSAGESEVVRLFCVPINQPFAQACVEVLQQFRALANGDFTPDTRKQSVIQREIAELEELKGPTRDARLALHSLSVDAATLTWQNAIDHIRALEHDILMQPPPVWSPLALARVVLEGCTFTHYLVEPTVSTAIRLARSASLLATESQHQLKAAAEFGPDEQVAARAKWADAEALLQAAGVVERLSAVGKRTGYSVDGATAPMDHNVTDRVKSFMPSWAQGPYRLLSGAAHSRIWMINRGRVQDGGWTGESATVMAAVMTVLGALESGVAVWAGYLNVDVSELLGHMESERMAFMARSIGIAHAAE